LEWVDRQGNHLSFASDKGVFLGPRLSRDARRILVGTGDPAADAWVFDASGQNKARLTFDGYLTSEAVWSPDNSQFVVNVALPNSPIKTVVKASSGAGNESVIADSSGAPTDWSPDGRYLLVERYLHGKSEIWQLPLTPGETTRPLLPSSTAQGLQSSGQFSPDGKFVAFTMVFASGPQVFIVPFPSGNGMWQVSVDGGHWPRWRRDGKELYFVSMRNVLTAVDIREKGDSVELGHPVPLFAFRPGRVYRVGMIGYDVTPDGHRFLLNAAADENIRPLTLLLNWDAELNKK
jgi:Tol biopolymer transport system component